MCVCGGGGGGGPASPAQKKGEIINQTNRVYSINVGKFQVKI